MKTQADFDTIEEYVTYLEQANAEAKAKANKGSAIRFKVSEKGAMSAYGLGRFPVTLYKEQWLRLFSHAQEAVDFLKEHNDEFSTKSDKPAIKAA